jgi:hypothetical protein
VTDKVEAITIMHRRYGVNRLYECGQCAQCRHVPDETDSIALICTSFCSLSMEPHTGYWDIAFWNPQWTACGKFEEAK